MTGVEVVCVHALSTWARTVHERDMPWRHVRGGIEMRAYARVRVHSFGIVTRTYTLAVVRSKYITFI